MERHDVSNDIIIVLMVIIIMVEDGGGLQGILNSSLLPL